MPGRCGRAWLALSAHLDAARVAPRAYLTASWWWLRGKRLRARSQFAPLLGVSSKAYQLWILKQIGGEDRSARHASPPIVALVDIGVGRIGLNETLLSLTAAGVPAHLVDSGNVSALAETVRQIDWQEKPWLMPIMAGDIVAPAAVQAYRAAIIGSETRIIYADDDLVDGRGRRIAPHFKPSWNSELFRHFDYMTGACIARAQPEDLEGLSGEDWAGRLVASLAARTVPLHLPQVLHHRRRRPRPRIPATFHTPGGGLPPVSVIIPTRNRHDLLHTCLAGLENTDYPDLEIIIVDNDSDDPATLAYLSGLDPVRYRVLRHPGPFNFSAMNNRAASEARGQLLCLLNNDIEVVTPGWLKAMATQALREDVGAVGAQLLYPDGRIQHAGVVLGVGGAAAHAHRLLRPNEEGYFHRHALPQFTSAVTAACLVVMRPRFLAVGGLDEGRFAVAFNDVDLCMRLNRRGWQSLYEPRAMLIHHESVSRGFDRDPIGAARLARELAALQELWGTGERIDPFHHPELSRFSERFVVRL
ncbi:glycosyltransferase family 2 protein [Edaphosphingomonas haloaromaticamans]|uniref:Glycosyl transferase family 2 n=1 Tax=Edaphosphingomonas haloaromaticamans TaxID=653954 RepID=A0A1S1H6P4_9SPHN|nr:glycosyltransferase family 2 protein [Sphingomonas haloaromaticamans]OHT17744.1 Glycosyl transferase family 2 [Sphingomonas haloaromaticamans]OHT18296.1 Glycosyl transferase family 2 [Sphingomonas haloaromaticamans]